MEKLNELEKLSKKYGLASRAMSLVAIVKRESDKPGELPKTIVVPVDMPQDVEFSAYFQQPQQKQESYGEIMKSVRYCIFSRPSEEHYEQPIARDNIIPEYCMHAEKDVDYDEDLLTYLAGEILPDGGLSGNNDEERWLKTAIVLFYFIENRRTLRTFRHLVAKMISFLKNHPLTNINEYRKRLVSMAEQEVPLHYDVRQILDDLIRYRRIDVYEALDRIKRLII